MVRLWSSLGIVMLSMPALAAKPCEELQAEIAERLAAKSVSAFRLDIVATTQLDTRTVVGSCEGGNKKIVYSRATVEAPPLPASAANAMPARSSPSAPTMMQPMPASPLPRPSRTESGGKVLRDVLADGGQGPAMLVIPAGEFVMGSPQSGIDRRYLESPEHRVVVAKFTLSRTEVTFDEYDRFAKATKQRLPDDAGQGRGNRPVVNVSWIDATAYAQWLTTQTGVPYRLPTEAEWEYAARAGGKPGAAYSTGRCISGKQANFNDAADTAFNNCPASNVSLGQAQPVASYAPNAFGLYDMHGNVFEWTADCVHLTYEQGPGDGRAWQEEAGGNCAERMVRGGSWQSAQISVRSSLRAALGYADSSGLIGFRVVRDLSTRPR